MAGRILLSIPFASFVARKCLLLFEEDELTQFAPNRHRLCKPTKTGQKYEKFNRLSKLN